jgi:hypothetical protein
MVVMVMVVVVVVDGLTGRLRRGDMMVMVVVAVMSTHGRRRGRID